MDFSSVYRCNPSNWAHKYFPFIVSFSTQQFHKNISILWSATQKLPNPTSTQELAVGWTRGKVCCCTYPLWTTLVCGFMLSACTLLYFVYCYNSECILLCCKLWEAEAKWSTQLHWKQSPNYKFSWGFVALFTVCSGSRKQTTIKIFPVVWSQPAVLSSGSLPEHWSCYKKIKA